MNIMKEKFLEDALRRIACSGDPDIVYGYATALRGVLKTDEAIDSMTEFLNERIKAYEEKHGEKLSTMAKDCCCSES